LVHALLDERNYVTRDTATPPTRKADATDADASVLNPAFTSCLVNP
jgi:hypothetical protein